MSEASISADRIFDQISVVDGPTGGLEEKWVQLQVRTMVL